MRERNWRTNDNKAEKLLEKREPQDTKPIKRTWSSEEIDLSNKENGERKIARTTQTSWRKYQWYWRRV